MVPRLAIVCLSAQNSDSDRLIECGTFLGMAVHGEESVSLASSKSLRTQNCLLECRYLFVTSCFPTSCPLLW